MDLLADLAEGAEDGVQVVVGEREVKIADVHSGFGRHEAAAALTGVGETAGRRRRGSMSMSVSMGTGMVMIVVVVAAAEARRQRLRPEHGCRHGHGHGQRRPEQRSAGAGAGAGTRDTADHLRILFIPLSSQSPCTPTLFLKVHPSFRRQGPPLAPTLVEITWKFHYTSPKRMSQSGS